MKLLSFVLLVAPFASAFASQTSLADCKESSTSRAQGSTVGSYPLPSPHRSHLNGTHGYNSTLKSNTTSTRTASVNVYGSATNTFTAFPTDVFTSIPTLKPVIPAYHDADSLGCLDAQKAGPGIPLHYAEESKPGAYEAGVFAMVTPQFKMPSVVLDYANAANMVKIARGGDLIIGFSDLQAFLRSLKSWQNLKEIVFITFTEGCGDYSDGERCYFLAQQLIFDQGSLTIRAIGNPKDVRDLAESIDVSWGSYKDDFSSASPIATTPGGSNLYPFPKLTPGGNGTTTNSTNTTTANFGQNGLCAAPADTKYGLPSACIGPHFDETLDEKLGYKESKDFAWADWVQTASLIDPYTEPVSVGSANLTKRNLKDKLGSAISALKTLPAKTSTFGREKKKELVKGLQNTGNKIESTVKTGVKTGIAVGTFVKNVITGEPNIIEEEFNKLILPPKKDNPECLKNTKKCALQAKDAKLVKSPWDDDGILIKSWGTAPSESELIKGRKTRKSVKGQFVNVYCVKCGLHGSAKVKGKLTIKDGEIHEGTVDVDMSMKVGVGVGIYAQKLHKESFDFNLFNVPVSPFTIGVLTIGPYISIGTRATVMVNATGTLLARADLEFAKAKFSYDFKKGAGKQIGFNPQFVPKFEAEGEIQLAATFGVPVAIKVGLSTAKGCKRCEAAVGIEDYPHIKAEARFGLQASFGGQNITALRDPNQNSTLEAGVKKINNCTGVWAGLSIGNDLSMVFNGFGFIEQQIDLWKMPNYPIKSWCLGKKDNDTTTKKESKRFFEIGGHEYDLKNYPRDGLNSSTDVVDLAKYVVSDVDNASWDGPEIPILSYELEDEEEGFWYSTIILGHGGDKTSIDQAINLVSCNDGNLYMQENKTTNALDEYKTCGSLWGGFEDAILSNPNGGFLYYYGNAMNKVGVSRIRSTYAQEVPDTAVMVVLAPLYYDEANKDASVLAAFDENENMFLPVVCTYTDSKSAKIYLVKDLDEGISKLKSADLKYTVTNGDVADCKFLPLTSGADMTATESTWAGLADTDATAFEEDIEFDESAFENGAFIEEVEQDDEWYNEFDELMFDADVYFD